MNRQAAARSQSGTANARRSKRGNPVMKIHQVVFQPSGRRGGVPEGSTVLEAARSLGVDIESLCGGAKSCGKCRIKCEAGTAHLSPFTDEEAGFISDKERAEGFRLACAAEIRGNLVLFVPEESRRGAQVVRKEATDRIISLNPAVRLFPVTLAPPDLTDPQGDYDRLVAALAERYRLPRPAIDYPALRGASRRPPPGELERNRCPLAGEGDPRRLSRRGGGGLRPGRRRRDRPPLPVISAASGRARSSLPSRS